MNIIELIRNSGTDIAVPLIDTEITGICYDSRRAKSGDLFVSVRGTLSDGHDFARSAYDRGCRAFVCEYEPKNLPSDALVLYSANTRSALGLLASEFYGHPEKKLRLIGITGTKGKTSTALMIKTMLDACGLAAGYIGSNGVDFAGFHFDTVNTTPEGCDIYDYLARMVKCGIGAAVLEVSSQALYMERVRGLVFDICIFTNLSRDHIGCAEHPDMEHYKMCKKKLFSEHLNGTALINSDDPVAEEFADTARKSGAEVKYFSTEKNADFRAQGIALTKDASGLGSSFELNTEKGKLGALIHFPGEFSVSNATAAAAVCELLGVPLENIARELPRISISGRFETISLGGVDYIIDYAHNAKSLRSALTVLRKYEPRRLICLFGSVGGRTFGRRAELGAAAAELADLSILTADNPDNEPAEEIIAEIARQYDDKEKYVAIPDRKKAIEYAMRIAEAGDIVLLAGKGHENYQLIAGRHEPFCERDILLSK